MSDPLDSQGRALCDGCGKRRVIVARERRDGMLFCRACNTRGDEHLPMGAVDTQCLGAGVDCPCGADHGDGHDRNEWSHGGNA